MTTTSRSNFVAGLRTVILMAALGGLLVVIGYAIGGIKVASVFLVIALVMNFVAYWFSDKIAIASAGAKPVTEAEAPRLYQIVRDLTTRAKLPMPKLYVIPSEQANAFATGATPSSGGRRHLGDHQAPLRGRAPRRPVTRACHVRNRDILTTSIASAIGAMITWIAYLLLWFGGDDQSPLGLIANLALFILAPISATLIQLAIRASASTRRTRRGRDLRQPRVARLGAPAAGGGRQDRADAGQPGDRAALHRQAVLGRRHRQPVLHAPADRGAGPPAPPDAADPLLGRGGQPRDRARARDADVLREVAVRRLRPERGVMTP